MKKLFALTALIISVVLFSFHQGHQHFPNVQLKNLAGNSVQTSSWIQKDGPILVTFWATWCTNCLKELKTVNTHYDTWKKDYGLEVYAVSIDDAKAQAKIPDFKTKRAWKFPVMIDNDKALSKALNVQNPPVSFIIDKTGHIVWQHTGFKAGDELEIEKILKSLK